LVDRIHALGAQAGLAIVPSSPLSMVEPMLEDIDLLLIMTVNPGFGGQKLIPFCVDKIRSAHALRSERGARFLIECDGGVNEVTTPELLSAGTDMLVAGSAFFGSADPARLVSLVRNSGKT
ncbi:MAG: ribulose-phosphate 3-epimerase, partial [bacterium]